MELDTTQHMRDPTCLDQVTSTPEDLISVSHRGSFIFVEIIRTNWRAMDEHVVETNGFELPGSHGRFRLGRKRDNESFLLVFQACSSPKFFEIFKREMRQKSSAGDSILFQTIYFIPKFKKFFNKPSFVLWEMELIPKILINLYLILYSNKFQKSTLPQASKKFENISNLQTHNCDLGK